MKIKNKVFVVIVGSNRMGRELTLKLLEKGAHVIAVDPDAVTLAKTIQLAKSRGYPLTTFITNITDKKQVENLLNKILSEFGRVDGIINNAGTIQPFVKVDNTEFDIIEQIFNVNLFGTLNMIKVFLPYLLTRQEAHLINISSMYGFLPVAGQAIQGASKAAVRLLSDTLAIELKETGVNVTTVIPGTIYTGNKANIIAVEIIIKAIEKNKSRIFVGKDMQTINMLYRISPSLTTKLIHERIKHKVGAIL